MHNPDRVEYSITSGHIQIAMEDGSHLPAYWSQPDIASRVPGLVLIHDWWGVSAEVRHLAHRFAQSGHYVIVPDLFHGKTTSTPEEALKFLDELGNRGYRLIDSALSVLEAHHRCNANVAAVGLGMGGSLAFEAAIVRRDLEAVIAFSGFPQRYLGHFRRAHAPVLAIYGAREGYIAPDLIERLRQELAGAPLPHEVVMLEGVGHDIFAHSVDHAAKEAAQEAWHKAMDFLARYLGSPMHPAVRKKIL